MPPPAASGNHPLGQKASGELGQSPWSARKWSRYIEEAGIDGAPADLREVVAEVARLRSPVFRRLG